MNEDAFPIEYGGCSIVMLVFGGVRPGEFRWNQKMDVDGKGFPFSMDDFNMFQECSMLVFRGVRNMTF